MAVPGRLDVEATLYSGQAFRWVRRGHGWHRGFIRNTPVAVRWRAGRLSWQSLRPLTAPQVRAYFRLDASHDEFVARAPNDPLLGNALSRFPGLRLLRQDPWETFVSFLLSQNSNEAKIRATIEALCRISGRPVRFLAEDLFAFPTPAALARLTHAQLRSTGMGYRADYLQAATRLVQEGRLRPRSWAGRPYEEVFEELLQVPGVGEKVADCILLYGCDHLQAFPSDVWVRRFVRESYLPDPSRPSHKAIRDFAWRQFGPHAGYAQHYLFHYRRRVGALSGNPS